MVNMRRASAIVAVALFSFTHVAGSFAQSLAGSVGDQRRKVMFTNEMVGGCKDAFDRYVAAAGHSAYASTAMGGGEYDFICAAVVDMRSKEAAETAALESCTSGRTRYKIQIVGPCEIIASK